MSKPAKNTSSGPVVIDGEGHTLGGGEWGEVDPGDPRVVEAVEAGVLVVTDQGPDTAAPDEPPADEKRSRSHPKESS